MKTFRDKTRLCYPANPQGVSLATVPWGGFCLDCAHQRNIPNKPKQSTGYCAALNVGDWMRGEIGVMWDGLKICHLRPAESAEAKRPRFADRPRFDRRPGRLRVIFDRDAFYTRYPPPRAAGWRLAKERFWARSKFDAQRPAVARLSPLAG